MSRLPHFPWMNPEIAGEMIRAQGLDLFGCLTVLAEYAGLGGRIAQEKAVRIFAAAPRMNQRKAEQSVSRLVEAGWVDRSEEVLSIIGYGTSAAPDYARQKSD